MSFNLGIKALRRLVLDGDALAFHRAKLTDQLFKGDEKKVLEYVRNHVKNYSKLPKLETLENVFGDVKDTESPEPAQYYLDMLLTRFEYDVINKMNLASQELLKQDKSKTKESLEEVKKAVGLIEEQRYRTLIMDFGKEAGNFLMQNYAALLTSEVTPSGFGWPYLDGVSGGVVLPGDIVSIIGRIQQGKTWLLLNIAEYNWLNRHKNSLFVSMEMNTLAIAQRYGAMYTHLPVSQLKSAAFSSTALASFVTKIAKAEHEPAKFYILNGNLSGTLEDIYMLASQLGCSDVYIDGAYLVPHENKRLDRYTRIAENAELMKKITEQNRFSTYASWQFNRQAVKKGKSPNQKTEKAGLEDIAGSDAIGQISTIVLGLLQEDGVETLQKRHVDVLKGRNGEVGGFDINWDFVGMNFDQLFDDDQSTLMYE